VEVSTIDTFAEDITKNEIYYFFRDYNL